MGHFVSSYIISTVKESLDQNSQNHQPRSGHHRPPKRHLGPPRGPHHPPHHPPHHRRPPHPQVLGLSPENANSAILFTFLILGFSCTLFIASRTMKETARKAQNVFDEINRGNLSARIHLTKGSPENSIASQFNQMADKIEQLIADIKESERNKIEVFQELAHDIRTPVAGLNSLLETINEHSESMSKDQLQQFTSSCLSESKYIAKLVEDLLFISGVNKSKDLQNFSKINLYNLLTEEISLFHFKNIQLNTTCEDVETMANSFLIKRLFRNALENATGFAASQVIINVVDLDPHQWLITISDDGPGLREEDLKLFGQKSFSRKAIRSEQRLSIGLGSFIMKKIVEIHKGTITIENIVNESSQRLGAVLKITLPRV